jgi:hypothetical protein
MTCTSDSGTKPKHTKNRGVSVRDVWTSNIPSKRIPPAMANLAKARDRRPRGLAPSETSPAPA